MANTITKRIVRDGLRNAVVELIGILDTAVASIITAPAIQLSDFSANDPDLAALTGFRIDTLKFSITDGITANLYWQATAQQVIASLFGRGKLQFEPDAGLTPNSGAAGYNGNINLEVYNVAPPASTQQGYTILLEMTKLYRV